MKPIEVYPAQEANETVAHNASVLSTTPDWGLVHAYMKESIPASRDDGTSVLNIVSRLNAEKKKAIDDDAITIRAAISSLHIGQAVIRNRDEFADTMVQVGANYLEGKFDMVLGFDEPFLELSRKLLNLCASFRSYLEHQSTYFIRSFGRKSSTYLDWFDFLKRIEHDNQSYALIYGLRNYIQHVDMPPLNLSMNARDSESVTVSVSLRRDDLLSPTAQWSDNVRDFIRASNADIPIWTILCEWDAAFQSILQKATELRVQPSKLAAIRTLSIREEFGISRGGGVGICAIPTDLGQASDFKLHIKWIEEEKAGQVMAMIASDGSQDFP